MAFVMAPYLVNVELLVVFYVQLLPHVCVSDAICDRTGIILY